MVQRIPSSPTGKRRLSKLNRRLLLESLEARRLLARQVSGIISTPDNWSGTIQVVGDVTINNQLTIQPGTVIKSDQGRGIFLSGTSSVVAQGTVAQPIIFTSSQDDTVGEDLTGAAVGAPLRGHWKQLFVGTNQATIENFEVRYAGNVVGPGNTFGPYRLTSIEIATGATPTLRNGLVTDGDWTGIYVGGNATLDTINVQRVTQLAFVQRLNLSPTYRRLSASATAGNHVSIEGGIISTAQSWNFGGLPAHLQGDVVTNAALDLAPGTIIKVPEGRFVQALAGPIRAVGTALQPIIFTTTSDDSVGGDSNVDGSGSTPVAGAWESLYINNSDTTLTNVEVRYAGNVSNPGNGFGPYRVAGVNIDGSPTLTNVRVRDSENIGLQINTGAPRLSGVTVERSGRYAIHQALDALPQYVSVALSSNAQNFIGLVGGVITSDRTWNFIGLPVHVLGDLRVNPGVTLTLASGTILKFGEGAYFETVGTLVAQGTAANPIILTSRLDDTAGGDSQGDGPATASTGGQWESLYIGSSASVLDNVEVRYAGNVSNPGNPFGPYRVAAVQVTGAAQPTLRNSRIFMAENIGLHVQTTSAPRLESLRIERSGREAIFQEFQTNPIYAGVVLSENQGNRITWEGGTVNTVRAMDFQGIPVHLTNNLTVAATASLTFAPGTILKMPEGAYVHAPGPLIAQGTAERPIVFTTIQDDSIGGDSNANGTSTAAGPGMWEAVYLDSSASILTNVEIRYAGNESNAGNTFEPYRTAALHVRNSSSPTIRNTRVRFGENRGLSMEAATAPLLDGLVIEGSGREAIAQALSAVPVYAGVQVRNNGADRITLTGGTLTGVRTFDFNSIPIHLTSDLTIAAGSSLTLAAGTVLKFPQGQYFLASGTLIAQGTATAPVVLTSLEDDSAGGDSNGDGMASNPTPGNWEALYIDSSASVLDNVQVRFAGNLSNAGNTFPPYRLPAVNIRNSSSPTIRNMRISFAENVGLGLDDNTAPQLQSLRIDRAGREAISQALTSQAVYQDLQVSLNQADRVTLQGGSIANTRNFDFNGVPVYINGDFTVLPSANLTIAPGSIFKLNEGAYFLSQGRLNATGTTAQPIIFTSLSDDGAGGDSNGDANLTLPIPGRWEGFYIDSSTTTLSNVQIKYAGNESNAGNTFPPYRTAALHIRSGAAPTIDTLQIIAAENDGVSIESGSSLTLTNSRLTNLGGTGINVTHGTLTLTNSTIQDAPLGIRVAANQTASGTGNAFVGLSNGVRNENTTFATANFVSNWWNSPSGPHDPSSVDGRVNNNLAGTPVSDYVDYGTWLTAPPARRNGAAINRLELLASLDGFLVHFAEPIDPSSFTASDIQITGPVAMQVQSVVAIDRLTYKVNVGQIVGSSTVLRFSHGDYAVTVGPNVNSTIGLSMDQNANGISGQSSDTFSQTLRVDLRGPVISAVNPASGATLGQSFASIDVTFSENVRLGMIPRTAVTLTRPDQTSADVLGVIAISDTVLRVLFEPQLLEGQYTFKLAPSPAITDTANNQQDQNSNGIAGELPQDTFTSPLILQRRPLKIVSQIPSLSTNDAITQIDVTFSDPIQTGSFSPADVSLIGPLGNVGITAVTRLSETRYRISVQAATADGIYNLTVGPAINDIGGIAMDQDGDGFAGELEDRYRSALQLGGAGPQVLTITPKTKAAAPLEFFDVSFSEPIDFSSLTAVDIVLTGPGGAIPVIATEQVSPTVARVRFATQSADGSYTLKLGPNVTDLGGTAMDHDLDGVSGEVVDDVFGATLILDAIGPRVLSTLPTGGVNVAMSTIDITFSEPIASTSLTPANFTLTGPSGAIALTRVTFIAPTQVRLEFPQQTTRGAYTLTVGSAVHDLVGNRMDSNGNGILGETADVFQSTINIALPDLSIESATVPATAANGDVITIAYTVRNDQPGIARAPWTEQIVFSPDRFYGNNDDVILRTQTITTDLNGNSNATRTVTAAIPFGFTGQARIFVATDVLGNVQESNEDNNRLERPIEIAFQRPPADLVVDTITVAGTAGRGATLPISFRVRNDGTATTGVDQWNDQVFISNDTTLDGNDRSLAVVPRTGGLASATSYTATVNATVPADLPLGTYYILVRTDSTNLVVEPAAEDNNTLASSSLTVTNAPLPDLVISNLAIQPANLQSGDAITVQWTGANTGNLQANGTWTDRVYLSNDATLSSSDMLLGSIAQTRTLGAGANYQASLATKLPDGVSGQYFFIVVPDATNSINEGDGESTGTLASSARNIALFPYADLTVTQVTAPPLLIGDPVDLSVSWTVANVGAGQGRQSSWTDRIVLSRNAILGDGDDLTVGQFVHTGAMPSGTNYQRSEIIPLAARTSGRFTLFVQTDSLDEVFEVSGHASNQASPNHVVDITPTPYADLVVDSVTTTGNPVSGQSLSITWRVSNQGIGTTDTSVWTDYIYVSSDPTGANGLRLIGSSTHGGALGVNQNYTRTADVILPRDLSGTQYIFVRTGGPYEFIFNDAGNQKRSDAIDVVFVPPPPVDLRVESLSLGGLTQAFDSDQVEVTWTVRNDGPQTTESGWTDRLYLQSVTNANEVYEMGIFGTANALEAGKTLTRTELVRLPRTNGLYRFFVTADARSEVVETNENNNTTGSSNLQINLRPRADLRVSNVTAPSSITAGTILDVKFTVSNNGTADTPSGNSRWTDRVWLSSSASSLSGAILLGDVSNQSALGFPGTTTGSPTQYRTERSFTIPRAISGNWFVVIQTDVFNAVDEYPSEDNNLSATALAIDANPVPPPDLVAQSITGPGDIFDDSKVKVRYRVANLGAGPTDPGSWSDQIWLTLGKDGPRPLRGDIFLGTVSHDGVLQVGQAYEAETTVNIPKGVSGQYFLTVYTDASNRVYEAAFATNSNPDAPNDLEGSNYRSTPINVLLTPPADLQVTRVQADASGVGDQRFTVTWQVTNNGAGTTDREVWADAIYVSQDNILDGSDQLVFALPQPGPLTPGQSYEHSATFTLPPSAQGKHILVRTNVDPSVAETDEDRFLQEVRAVLTRIEAATGQSIGDVKVSDLKKFTRQELLDILAGPTNTLATVYEGPYTNNNVGAGATNIVSADADLRVKQVTASPAANSGETLTVNWSVENIGDYATANETTSVEQLVFLSKDPVFDFSRAVFAKRVTYNFTAPLAKGQSFDQSTQVATPPGSSGRWYAHVFVNIPLTRYGLSFDPIHKGSFPDWMDQFAGRVWETRLTNNGGTSNEIQITYAEADLRVTDFSAVPVDPNSGGQLRVSMTVKNEGTRTTRVDQWSDALYLSTDQSLDTYDVFLGNNVRQGTLAPGQSYTFTADVRVPDNIGGRYYLVGATDRVLTPWAPGFHPRPLTYPIQSGPARLYGGGIGSVAEFADEDDNLIYLPLDVKAVATPDLVVDTVTASDRVELGQQFSVTYTVSNDGGAIPPTQVPYFDRVYLSRDKILDIASDHFVGDVQQNSPLIQNGSITTTRPYWLPRGLTGSYYVIVVSDTPSPSRSTGEVIESDEDNNIAISALPILIVTPPPTDLQVVDISAAGTVQVGAVSTVTWTVENRGQVNASGRWADAVYLSSDAVWDIGDRFLGRVEPTIGRTLLPGQSYSASLDFETPITLPGSYRILVRTDIFDDVFEGENNRNNNSVSASTIDVTVPELRLDIPLADQLASGTARLYRIETQPGQTIRIDLDSTTNVGSHELFARFEDLPTPYSFDARYEGYLRADQSLIIPETLGGRYYILARAGVRSEERTDGTLPANAPLPIQLTATRIPFGITDVSPDSGGDDRYVTVRIRGAEFPAQATVRLVRPELAEFAPVSFQRVNATELVAVFDLRNAPHGLYDVQVLHPDGRIAVDPYRFQVEEADPLEVNAGVGGPSIVGLGETGSYGVAVQSLANVDTPYTIIEYAIPNIRNVAGIIPGPAITMQTGVRGDRTTVAPLFSSISTFDFGSVAPELNLQGALTGRAVAMDLPAGATTELGMSVTVYPELRELLVQDPDFLSSLRPDELDALSFDFYVVASATPLTTAQYRDYQLQEAERLRQAILNDANAPTGLRGMAASADQFGSLYLQALEDLGLLRAEDTPPFADLSAENVNAFFIAVGGLLGGDAGDGILGDAAQNFGSAATTLGNLVEKLRAYYGHTPDVYGGGFPALSDYDLHLANPTSTVAFKLRAGLPREYAGQAASQVIFNTSDLGQFSSDTVTITAPTTSQSAGMVPRGVPLPYTINATYAADATQPAREIRIVVPLDDTLDERSFQLSDINLGGITLPVPAGRPSFVGEFNLTETQGYMLQVTAGVDATTRNATWLLRAVDARDGLPPRDTSIGLLRPGQQISVGFGVEAETVAAAGTGQDVKTGDPIELTARVIIDSAAPVDSQLSRVTLDAVAPTSTWTIVPLGNNRYRVEWSAQDDTGGSGVGSYSLLVSTDGGSRYRTLLYQTSLTEYIATVESTQTPQFLIRAIDKAGNVEAAPAGARVPQLNPPVNLGTPPVAAQALPLEVPRAAQLPSTASTRVFEEAALGILSQRSSSSPSQFTRVVRPLAAERLAVIPGESGAGIGALALAVSPDGKTLFASGGSGRNVLYRLSLVGGNDVPATVATLDSPIYDLVFDEAGQLWASTGGTGLLQLDPTSGAILARYGAGVSLGIVAIPGQAALYVATTGGVLKFNTATRRFEAFSSVRVDALAIDPSGTLYGTQWPDGGRVLRFDFRGEATAVGTITDAESLSFGAAGSLLDGLLIVGHQNAGTITLLDPKSLRQFDIASSGSGRVEQVVSLGDGRFLATQGTQIDQFFSVAAPKLVRSRILDGNNLAALSFDVALKATTATDPVSALNPTNYTLVNLDTNEPISIGAINYDAANRTARMLFEQLPPAPYRLTVASHVQSEQGIAIGGTGAAVDFRVFENVTATIPVRFSNTRINRKDGTLLVDVTLTNQGTFDVAGPIQLAFGALNDPSVAVVGATVDSSKTVEVYATGRLLAAGQSVTQTIALANPLVVDLDLTPTVRAALPPNQLPSFTTTPNIAAALGQAYNYAATAQDPDGATVSYVLAKAPAGASISSTTGQLNWSPDRFTEPQVDFEIRAYDGRGAYRRQTWRVNVSGANRAPIVSPIEDRLISEGDTLSIPVSAFDPDGDRLFYLASNLPAGATFDAATQVLRWRPDAHAAGVYEQVALIASDGYAETSVLFTITVVDRNTPPSVSPLNNLLTREGDAVSFRVVANDPDGQKLRYTSPNLPPGAFLDVNTGVFEWTPGFNQHGKFNLQFFVSDGIDTVRQTMSIDVVNQNGQVQFAELTPFELFEGQTLKLRVAATDPEYPAATTIRSTQAMTFLRTLARPYRR